VDMKNLDGEFCMLDGSSCMSGWHVLQVGPVAKPSVAAATPRSGHGIHLRVRKTQTLTPLLCAGMHFKMLKPCCEESQRLVDWVEKGEGPLLSLLCPAAPCQSWQLCLQQLPLEPTPHTGRFACHQCLRSHRGSFACV
jgi:hypothetical protein